MYNIDFSEPLWIVNYYHFIGISSLLGNIFGIYLLIFQTKELGEFRYYLLLFQVVCTATDLNLTTFMKFLPYYPINALGTIGYFSQWFNMPTHYCMLVSLTFIYYESECLALCFFQKHQKIASVIDVHVIPRYAIIIGSLIFLAFPVYPIIAMQILDVGQEKQLEYIKENLFDYYAGFSTVPHFAIYVDSPLLYSVYSVVLLTMGAIFGCLVLVNTDLIRLMVRLKPQISQQNYQKHAEAIQSLIVQMFVAGLCALPLFGVAFVLAFQMENGQLIGKLMFVCCTCHSTINMISLFIFFPPYRRYLLKKFGIKRRSLFQVGASSVLS
ncbi:Serpentine Receptor, class I [Caenorhabditis elegans]|uniref:Serpentine Receptor, class I n=1 Tax=Caenorhabditis elegans TaxID=6239 RepID=O45967_CAEEL|nr:Serpentine Receptor, class I [Caenorhabditis elegans]CAA16428.3 Serpentine Receptor, class I [Caenorhabditis elegans]|eukprot:NP_507380.3 Serpentine Receptor, class I [Caenorhabditis elegans]